MIAEVVDKLEDLVREGANFEGNALRLDLVP